MNFVPKPAEHGRQGRSGGDMAPTTHGISARREGACVITAACSPKSRRVPLLADAPASLHHRPCKHPALCGACAACICFALSSGLTGLGLSGFGLESVVCVSFYSFSHLFIDSLALIHDYEPYSFASERIDKSEVAKSYAKTFRATFECLKSIWIFFYS